MAEAKPRVKLWFALHGWMALPVWLFLFFICVTGTIATVDKELMWLFDSTVRANAPEGMERRPLNAVVADVERQIPGAHVNRIRFGEPFMALEVMISTPERPSATAWVNPYTGEVQRVSTGINFPNFLRSLHGWLLMPWMGGTPIGWYAVCLTALPMLGSVVTGLVIYKRFWRAFTSPRIRLGSGSRVFWGDLHRMAGVWSLWFIIVISLTGLWFLVRGILYDVGFQLGIEPPDIPRHEAPLLADGQTRPRADLDAALAAVLAHRPGSTPATLVPPEHARAPVVVYCRSAFPLLYDVTWVHPYTNGVMGGRDAGNAGAVAVISSINAALHYGNFGGVWVKLIWTVFGLTLSSLVLAGTVIWTKRTAFAGRRTDSPVPATDSLVAEGAE